LIRKQLGFETCSNISTVYNTLGRFHKKKALEKTRRERFENERKVKPISLLSRNDDHDSRVEGLLETPIESIPRKKI